MIFSIASVGVGLSFGPRQIYGLGYVNGPYDGYRVKYGQRFGYYGDYFDGHEVADHYPVYTGFYNNFGYQRK